MPKRVPGIAAAVLAGLVLVTAPAAADNQFGALDPTFGDGSGFVIGVNGAGGLGDVVVDGGKIIASGPLGVYRLNNNGTPDGSFGAGGFVSVPGHGSNCCGPARVRVDRRGRVVRSDPFATGGFADPVLAAVNRFLPDGTPDPDFGTNGRIAVQVATAGIFSEPRDIAVLPDDSIMVVGRSTTGAAPACNNDIFLMRLTDTGGPYPGFGTNGVLHLSPSNLPGLSPTPTTPCGLTPFSMALAPDGALVIAGDALRDNFGSVSTAGILFRVSKDGAVDGSFGTGGVVEFPRINNCSSEITRAAVDGFGRVVALRSNFTVNCANTQWSVARYDERGAPDAGFTTYAPAVGSTTISDVIVQPNGLPLLVGGAPPVQGILPFVTRLGLDGLPDPTFGNGGTSRLTPVPGATGASGADLAWDPAGYAVGVGAEFHAGSKALVFRLSAGSPPSVTISGPDTGVVGTPIALKATPGATAGVGTPNWDLDNDGVFADASGTTVTVTPKAAGALTVAAQVTDATGLSGTAKKTLTISAAPPPAPGAAAQLPGGRPTLATTRIKVKRGSATISLACAKTAACAGTATLSAGKKKLASARYAIKAGARKSITFKLPAAFRKKLKKARKLKLSLTLKPASGAATKKTVTLTTGG